MIIRAEIFQYLFGPVAQLGERTVRIRKVESSILFVSTTSEQALYCLLRLFIQKSVYAHAAAPSFQTTTSVPSTLGVALKAAASVTVAALQTELPP